MQMHQVRYFLALCRELNFTRAAKSCGVAQPSLTNALKALEDEMKGKLFDRFPRVQLTELGWMIKQPMERIYVSAEEVKRFALRDSGPSSQGTYGKQE
jgi:DNA-binding transcriptional LysR family regulator